METSATHTERRASAWQPVRCDFTGAKQNHVVLGPKVKSTVITATRFLGGMKLEDQGKGKVETGLNMTSDERKP